MILTLAPFKNTSNEIDALQNNADILWFYNQKTIGDQKKKNQNPENEEREIMEYDDYGITMIHVKDLMFSIQISHLYFL